MSLNTTRIKHAVNEIANQLNPSKLANTSKTQDSATSDNVSTPTQRLYKGSCHCGFTKYIVHLTLLPLIIYTKPEL
ncbi:hypothetical protein DL95DRAFT_471333 [Leptodontidium sp. 2 PMI_412]|nr:hypothetical protein DL95DRAFT_471333 [Leptodontidium sp. 2 PMI_412]